MVNPLCKHQSLVARNVFTKEFKGPGTYDVRKILRLFQPLPLVTLKQPTIVCFSVNPFPLLSAEVI